MECRHFLSISFLLLCLVSCSQESSFRPTAFGPMEPIGPKADTAKQQEEHDGVVILPLIAIEEIRDVNLELGIQHKNNKREKLNFGASSDTIEVSDNYLRIKLLNNLYQKYSGDEKAVHFPIQHLDEYTYLANLWSPLESIKNRQSLNKIKATGGAMTGKGRMEFSVTMAQTMPDQASLDITDIDIAYGFINGGVDAGLSLINSKASLKRYRNNEAVDINQALEPQFIEEVISRDLPLMFTVKDFYFKDQQISLSQKYLKLYEQYAKVIVSLPGKTQVFFVKPGHSFEQFLQAHFGKVQFSNEGQVLSLGDESANLGVDLNFVAKHANLFNKGFFVSLEQQNLRQVKLTKSATYTLIYTSWSEILNKKYKHQAWEQATDLEVTGRTEIKVDGSEHWVLELSANQTVPQYKQVRTIIEAGYEEEYKDPYSTEGRMLYRDRWEKNCEVEELQLADFKQQQVWFNQQNLSTARLLLEIGDQRYPLDQFLVTDPEFLDGGSQVLLQLQLPAKILANKDKIALVVLEDPNPKQIELGFKDWTYCPNYGHRKFRVKDYSTDPKPYLHKVAESYHIKLTKLAYWR